MGSTRIAVHLARAHLLYGEWLRRAGRRVDGRQNLRTAYEMLTAMGAEAFAERARRELAATGETVRKRTVETLDELTPQEAQIARLAREGRTNPEIGVELFISPRTVEWHLRKVLTKVNFEQRPEECKGSEGFSGSGAGLVIPLPPGGSGRLTIRHRGFVGSANGGFGPEPFRD